MTQILQHLDTNTIWFIAAVLVILFLSAFAGWLGARMEIRDYAKKRIAADKAWRDQWPKAVYHDIDIPAYQRRRGQTSVRLYSIRHSEDQLTGHS